MFTTFHLTPGLLHNERQGRHTPMPSSQFSLFAKTLVIHMVLSREIHPNPSFLCKHWICEEIVKFHEFSWNFMKCKQNPWNSTYSHGQSCI